MKRSPLLFTVAMFLPCLVHAEPPFQNDLRQLQQQRDKAIVAAIEGVNRRYEPSFDALMRKATTANDLDTAIQVKQVRTTISAIPSTMVDTDLIIGKWSFRAGKWTDERELKAGGWVESKMDGMGKWAVIGADLRLDFPNGNWVKFPLPSRFDTLVGKTQVGEKMTAIRHAK